MPLSISTPGPAVYTRGVILVWLLLLLLCLVQVWIPHAYLTCDGPCHLYNARIVHELWQGSTASNVYQPYYHLQNNIDPNSATTFLMAALLHLFSGITTEKVYISIYILLYSSGFTLLLRSLGARGLWLLTPFIFIFTYAFTKGFYNFSFGTACFAWMVYSWLRYQSKPGIRSLLLFFICSTVTYFSHLLPFTFGAIVCASLLVSHAWAAVGHRLRTLLISGSMLCLALLPCIALSLLFTSREGGLQLQLAPHPYRIIELVEFKYIINAVEAERPFALLVGCALAALGTVALLTRIRQKSFHPHDGLFIAFAISCFVYVFFPEEFMGRLLIISIRAQLYVMMLVAMLVAYLPIPRRIVNIGASVIIICFIVLSSLRLSCSLAANKALDVIINAGNYIKPGSSLLSFTYSTNGKDQNLNIIARRQALFHHAAQYLGADKPLLLLNNYEANLGYFPISWADGFNPYQIMNKGQGIDGLPPEAHINRYFEQTGRNIDYILFWCPSSQDSSYLDILNQMKPNYKLIHKDNYDRLFLYSRSTQNTYDTN